MAINNRHSSPHDIILSLPSHVVDDMINNGADAFPRPWRYFGPIPSHVQRIWVYEEDVEGITIMMTRDGCLPNHLYFITKPLYATAMERRYHFNPDLLPTIASFRILRRLRDHLRIIW
jgi:hypothetical protein